MSHSINFASIEKKVRAWEKSAAGQGRIKKKVNGYVLRNVEKTEAGSKVLTRRRMIELADKLVDTVNLRATGMGLPSSVLGDIATLKRGPVVAKPDGGFQVEMNFSGDMQRESLIPGHEPLKNIVVIFNNGYPYHESMEHVFGEWHGKMTHALEQRTGLYFLQDAVNEFNSTYGSQYDIFVELGDTYDSE